MGDITGIKQGKPVEEHPIHFDISDIASSILADAMAYCSMKMGISVDAVQGLVKERDVRAYSYFNYSITCQLGDLLGKQCKSIRAVYALDYYDDSQGEGLNNKADITIHVILGVERKTSAVKALLTSIHDALIQQYHQVLGMHSLKHVLNAHLVDDEDIEKRSGYGALLQSSYQTPIHVWGEKLTYV